jgi:hypothetical protein
MSKEQVDTLWSLCDDPMAATAHLMSVLRTGHLDDDYREELIQIFSHEHPLWGVEHYLSANGPKLRLCRKEPT